MAAESDSSAGGRGDGGGAFVAAIDQGTSSTRCIIFRSSSSSSSITVVSQHQLEHKQMYPRPGWVEHDALDIWERVQQCVRCALEEARLTAAQLSAVGITNQRESTLVWDRHTGQPYHNVIVWNDTRTDALCERLMQDGGKDRFRDVTGLPIASYFSASKLVWLLDNVPGLRAAAHSGDALFGTMDTWLLWKLTGGTQFATDVTNASRTLLMNVRTLQWDEGQLHALGVPRCMLPEIRSSSEVYGQATGVLEGVPIAGILGDQQAALFGQTCFDPGSAKCTYGTGAFILMNTGESLVPSTHGLLSTVGYKLGSAPCVYALEGSIAYAGSAVQWCRDNLGLFQSTADVEALARSVPDNGGVYFVPAFAGLFAPYWRKDARGTVCGLTAYNTKAHIARAVLEAAAFQVTEVLSAMNTDSGVDLRMLKVDGGMTANALLMQFQADILGTPVFRPEISETTALGAAFAAGLAVGVWHDQEELRSTWKRQQRFAPELPSRAREALLHSWAKAVDKSLDWIDDVPTTVSAALSDAADAAALHASPSPRAALRKSWASSTGSLSALASSASTGGGDGGSSGGGKSKHAPRRHHRHKRHHSQQQPDGSGGGGGGGGSIGGGVVGQGRLVAVVAAALCVGAAVGVALARRQQRW